MGDAMRARRNGHARRDNQDLLLCRRSGSLDQPAGLRVERHACARSRRGGAAVRWIGMTSDDRPESPALDQAARISGVRSTSTGSGERLKLPLSDNTRQAHASVGVQGEHEMQVSPANPKVRFRRLQTRWPLQRDSRGQSDKRDTSNRKVR